MLRPRPRAGARRASRTARARGRAGAGRPGSPPAAARAPVRSRGARARRPGADPTTVRARRPSRHCRGGVTARPRLYKTVRGSDPGICRKESRLAEAERDRLRVLPAVLELLDGDERETCEGGEEVAEREVHKRAEVGAPSRRAGSGSVGGVPAAGAPIARVKLRKAGLEVLLRRTDEARVVAHVDERRASLQDA